MNPRMPALGTFHAWPAKAGGPYDRPVPYIHDRAPRLIAGAADQGRQADGLVHIMGACYPNAGWSN